jgi:transcriptional regulator with PAS, ATPase and Fis domain
MSVAFKIQRKDGSFVPLEKIERPMIIIALKEHQNWTKAAKALGIGRSTLYRKIQDYNLVSYAQRLRQKSEQAKAKEKSELLSALEQTTNVEELCELLKVDSKTLQRLLQRHHLTLEEIRRRHYLARLRAEREMLEARGQLMIAA